MTPESKALVQESWDLLLPSAGAFAEHFFDRLLDLDPQLGRLFRATDMGEQGRRVVRAITTAVRGLDEDSPASSRAAFVPPAGRPVVTEALLDSLAAVLCERFTPRVCGAWKEFCSGRATELRSVALGDTGTSRVVPLARRLIGIGS